MGSEYEEEVHDADSSYEIKWEDCSMKHDELWLEDELITNKRSSIKGQYTRSDMEKYAEHIAKQQAASLHPMNREPETEQVAIYLESEEEGYYLTTHDLVLPAWADDPRAVGYIELPDNPEQPETGDE